MQAIRTTLIIGSMLCLMLLLWCGAAPAAGLRVVSSVPQTAPGKDLALDIVAEGIPDTGLSGVQFRLTVTAPGGTVTSVDDLNQAGTSGVSIAAPLLLSPPSTSRSGIGDFFWNARGTNGILTMDNESLVNGSGLYTLAQTSGATPPSGSGSVARFLVRVGRNTPPGALTIALSDVMLLDNGPAYPVDYSAGTSVQIQCLTTVPNLLGLSLSDASNALTHANLTVGAISKRTGAQPRNVVLQQSQAATSSQLCQAAIDLVINIPPSDVTNAVATDKRADETGRVLLTWTPATGSDLAGYRIYRGTTPARTDVTIRDRRRNHRAADHGPDSLTGCHRRQLRNREQRGDGHRPAS